MSDSYEFDRKTISAQMKDYVSELQKLGDEGWEVIKVPSMFLYDRWLEVRRLTHWAEGTQTWEYHSFNVCDLPGAWWDHIRSCGWTILEHPYYEYWNQKLHFAKRPGSLKGSDDGDVVARLVADGCSWSWFGGDHGLVAEVLKVKWDLSTKQGTNIGTERAVREWMLQTYLPRVFKQCGISMPDRPGEALLDELLSLRQAETRGDSVPWLDEYLIRKWANVSVRGSG